MLRAAGLLTTLCAAGGLATFAAQSSTSRTVAHRVVVGDTLWSLAAASHTSVARLQALNGLHTQTIQLGQVLQLPTTAAQTYAGAPSASDGSAASSGVGQSGAGQNGSDLYPASASAAIAASRDILSRRVIPTHLAAQGMIRAEAIRQGVPASLALAVADQESGFQQTMVSVTDAVGIMQVEPGTADWLSTYVVGRQLDRYDAHDNVVAGVSLLRTLLAQTDTRDAVAAYYQGLKAVRAHGMYPSTQQYVADVLALQTRFR